MSDIDITYGEARCVIYGEDGDTVEALDGIATIKPAPTFDPLELAIAFRSALGAMGIHHEDIQEHLAAVENKLVEVGKVQL